ncbi:cobalt-precorrin-7 (C(5))-methyltransferase [Nonomuraea sp. NBC_01738]|uniref:cobalt-precorrin-7 (C(5))-methyltransferase n=1 Tax=Nonomuraea sp. NBC_01738 TaxID=2976003 RepID=UPI002E12998C|nr:cobalt-precorrin-7 (C(5))-methyltransferase [Nonomuraea sp. NBC_01738]
MSVTVIGWDGSPAQAARLDEAALVIGPAALLAELKVSAPTASDDALPQVLDDHLEHGEGPAVVVAQGDPGFFGAVRALRAHGVKPEVLPAKALATSAFACAGLHWEDALVVSPAGPHQLARAVNACRAHPKVAVLCVPGVGPSELARELAPTTPRALIVCEDLGGPAQRVTHSRMGEATTRPWKDPDVVLVLDPAHHSRERAWVAGARPGPREWALPFGTGLPPRYARSCWPSWVRGSAIWSGTWARARVRSPSSAPGSALRSSPSNATRTPAPGCAPACSPTASRSR